MNERDFTNDLLSTEKYMTDSYSTFLNEASHQALYQDVLDYFYGNTKRTTPIVQPYVPKRLV